MVGKHARWKYFARQGIQPADWNQVSLDDTSWKSAETGIGYGDEDDRTVLERAVTLIKESKRLQGVSNR